MKTELLKKNRKNLRRARAGTALKATGPSYFEIEYLRQLREEMEIFLRSRGFNTIQELQVAFKGPDYIGKMSVKS